MNYELVTLILGVLAVVLLPALAFTLRSMYRWARLESKLDEVVKDLSELVSDKDRVHNAMLQTIREDRLATDRRLRWLEEHLWKRSN